MSKCTFVKTLNVLKIIALLLFVDILNAFLYHASLLLNEKDKGFDSLKWTVTVGLEGA